MKNFRKWLALFLAIALLALLSGCESSSLPEEVPEDFSFSLTWNTYGISSYDSSTGKLVKTNDATKPEDYVTTYTLSDEELQTVYDLIRGLDVQSYPDEYNPYHEGLVSVPSRTIILSVHTPDFDKTIAAEEIAYGSPSDTDAKGERFLSTAETISTMLMETDEWQALPEFEFFYE